MRRTALRMVDAHLDAATRPGYWGRVELILQDGRLETVRYERTEKIERTQAA